MEKRFTRNTDPRYWDEEQSWCNCGSFALNIREWYSPEWICAFDLYEDSYWDYLSHLLEEREIDEYEASDKYALRLIEGILKDFPNEVRFLVDESEINKDEELIEFRAVFINDEENDFHFKVFRDGYWMEKNGSGEVHLCSADNWDYGDLVYISNTYYLARKIA